MNSLVQPLCVQKSMAPVEGGILNQEEEWQLKQHLLPAHNYGVCFCIGLSNENAHTINVILQARVQVWAAESIICTCIVRRLTLQQHFNTTIFFYCKFKHIIAVEFALQKKENYCS